MDKIKYNDFNINNIQLERDSHTYILDNDKSFEFTSVTTFIAEFFDKFDALKIATKLVNNVPKYSKFTVDELIGKWNEARDHGTQVHNEIEDYLIDGTKPKEKKAILGIDWLKKHTFQEEHKVYSEKIIYSKDLHLAGSIDLIIQNTKTNQYSIVDWKTNAKITTSSFKNKMGTHDITSNIEDCKYSLYALQLSLYRYILEEFYGLNIYRQFIVHLTETEAIAYLTPYYKSHVEQLTNLKRISI